MDFKELWDKAGAPDLPAPSRAELEAMLGKESQGLLVKLKRQLRNKILWGVVLNLPMPYLLFLIWGNATLVTLVGFVLLMSAILTVAIYRYYRRLPSHLDMGQGMLPLMQSYDRIIRKALRFEERVGAFFIVPSPAMGAMFSLVADGKRTITDVLSDPVMLIVLGVVTVLVAPFAIWLTVWMNKYAFGKYLDKLRKNIAALEAA
jgi:hypothetical protein